MPASIQATRRQAEGSARLVEERPAPPRPAPPGDSSRDDRKSLLALGGLCVLVLLVALAFHLTSTLRQQLEDELADRLRLSAQLVTESLPTGDAGHPTTDAELRERLEEIRETTSLSDLVLYDVEGELMEGMPDGPAVPRRIRLANPERAEPTDPTTRDPEWDSAGGLSLVVPLGGDSGVGALLARIDRRAQGSLPTARLLFQVAKGLAAIVIVSGFLIIVRWLFKGGPSAVGPARTGAGTGSDVEVVLGTMKEVMTTLKDNETRYRDRATAAEADALRHRVTNDHVLASVSSGIIAFDLSGRITEFNRAAEVILAIRRRHAIGRPVASVFGDDDRLTAIASDLIDWARTTAGVEWSCPVPDGDPRWIGASSSVIRADDGTLLGGILLVSDLTQTKRLREQMLLKDRLSAVGEMSAGIAHEIKNSLHSLNGFANLLREDFADREPSLAVRGILSEVRSLESLVHGILEFSKPSRLDKQRVTVNDLVREIETRARAAVAEVGVRTELDLSEEVGDVLVDPSALRRVCLNLALNAIEAMPGGGELTITTRSTEFPSEGTDARRRGIRIAFRDTGPGIPESDRARVFTPFYTTKRSGNGLGLALAHKTVTDHGGRLQLHSRVGVGTEFVIHLPAEG
jgi:PAS domain S-box-containing protein